jgi:hypothetical protein
MPRALYGTGTMYYGRAHYQDTPRQSWVTTEWITLLGVPLVPIGTVRVFPLWETGRGSQRVEVQRLPIYWPQVALGYSITAVVALVLFLLSRL